MHGNAPTQLRHASTARTTKATKRATCTWTPGRPPRLLHHLPVWSATDSAAQLLRKCLQQLHSARPLKRHRSNPSPPRGLPHAAHLLNLHAPATAKQQSQLQTTIAHPPSTRSKVFHSRSHTGAPQRAMPLLELAIHKSAATTTRDSSDCACLPGGAGLRTQARKEHCRQPPAQLPLPLCEETPRDPTITRNPWHSTSASAHNQLPLPLPKSR